MEFLDELDEKLRRLERAGYGRRFLELVEREEKKKRNVLQKV